MTAKEIKDIEEASLKMEGLLIKEIESCCSRNGKMAGLGDDQTDAVKGLVYNIVKTMELSVLVNSKTHGLPVHVVLCSLIESIAGWSARIDELSGKPDISRN